MIAILVADDHVVVRSGVRSLLRDDPNMRIAAEARTAAEVLQQVGTRHFDVVLLDIRLPDGDGADLIPKVRKRAPTTHAPGPPPNRTLTKASLPASWTSC